jgi:hypothetical protein
VHFNKDDEIAAAVEAERRGRERSPDTGAFVAGRWQKP